MTSGGTVVTRTKDERGTRIAPAGSVADAQRLPALDARSWARFRTLLVDEVTRIAAFRSPDILEYGSGADAFASLTLAHAGYASIGIDASEADVRRARAGAERVSGGVRPLYLAMSLERLDFGDGAFDVVCGTRILHRLRLDRALVEIARVMRPSGAAVFVEPLGCSPLRLRDLRTARAHFGRVEVQAGPLWFVPRVRRQPGYGVLRLAEPF